MVTEKGHQNKNLSYIVLIFSLDLFVSLEQKPAVSVPAKLSPTQLNSDIRQICHMILDSNLDSNDVKLS